MQSTKDKTIEMLFNIIEIFIDATGGLYETLHAYDCTWGDNEKSLRCDYNKESSFQIDQYTDEETNEITYRFYDFHEDEKAYKKISLEEALNIVINQNKKFAQCSI